MSRMAQKFEALKQDGRRALIPYITAGDPAPWVTVPLMHALVKSGADVLELGVPFSDPMADGPVIQRAAERALKHHVSLTQVLALVREFRDKDNLTPVVLMGYLNPIEAMGYTRFAELAHRLEDLADVARQGRAIGSTAASSMPLSRFWAAPGPGSCSPPGPGVASGSGRADSDEARLRRARSMTCSA